MSRIVILDTIIDPKKLNNGNFYYYSVLENTDAAGKANEYSHGTACACVLDSLTENYDLFNVEILFDVPVHQGKPRGSVNSLKKGLLLCRELDADIICMSSVTSVLSDSRELYDITEELSEKSILIAALDNQGYVTVPSSYPFVVGVQADRNNLLALGEIASCEDNFLNADLYANCNFNWLNKMRCTPSNSLAVPVAAAHINNWINRGENIHEMQKKLKRYPYIDQAFFRKVQKNDVPIVAVCHEDPRYAYNVSMMLMDDIWREKGVQAVCLSSETEKYDIRVRKISSIAEDISSVLGCYKTELLFIAAAPEFYYENKAEINADIKIELRKDVGEFIACFDGKKLTEKTEHIMRTVYQLLT